VGDATLIVEAVAAGATTAAVVVALWASHRALKREQRTVQVEGRREAASDISQWLQQAETGILAWHDPENWRVPDGIEFGEETGIQPGDIVPPSQGRMGPSVETAIERFDAVRGRARLAFGSDHEVTKLVNEVIAAIRAVADHGVIYETGAKLTPRDYVDQTFIPLARDLFEALAESCELRGEKDRPARSGVTAADNKLYADID